MKIAPQPVRNLIQVWHVTAPDSIEIHRGHAVTHPHPKHWHDEYHVCAITAGAGYIEHRGSAHLTAKGTLIFVPPGEVHANHASDPGCSYENIYIPADLMSRAIEQACGQLRPGFPLLMTDKTMFSRFLQLVRVLRTELRLHRETAMLAFLGALAGRFSKFLPTATNGESKAIRTAREFLDAYFDREIALQELARVSELSPYHLSRVFRQQTGMPPHAYLIQRRIARAKTLLREKWPIAEVASQIGFADQSHLTRHFKRMVGVTPGVFVGDSKNIQSRTAMAD
jgi:AraC-like DNA-binding protein